MINDDRSRSITGRILTIRSARETLAISRGSRLMGATVLSLSGFFSPRFSFAERKGGGQVRRSFRGYGSHDPRKNLRPCVDSRRSRRRVPEARRCAVQASRQRKFRARVNQNCAIAGQSAMLKASVATSLSRRPEPSKVPPNGTLTRRKSSLLSHSRATLCQAIQYLRQVRAPLSAGGSAITSQRSST